MDARERALVTGIDSRKRCNIKDVDAGTRTSLAMTWERVNFNNGWFGLAAIFCSNR
jgi:hypothetical protein